MAAMSNYLENKIIDQLFRGQANVQAPALYVGLYTSAPSDSGGGTEVPSSNNYSRVQITSSLANWSGTDAYGFTGVSGGTSGNTANISAITFPAPSGNWGVVTSFGIFDNSTGGNLYFYGNLNVPKTINNGDAAPSFTANSLIIQIDN